MSAFSWPSDISWLAVDRVISSGTPSFGGSSARQSAPTAENPNPDSPLIRPEKPRITRMVISEVRSMLDGRY